MANFIPPIDVGQFQPSAAAISSWLYQIWKYLQDNPIQSTEQIAAEINETVPGVVEDYLEEHPVEAPVLSVNSMVGAVVLAYNNLVGSGSTIPIYRASSDEIGNQDLLDAWAEGCRFLLVDDTTPYMMYKTTSQGADVIALVSLSGSGGGAVDSVNGQTGVVVLTYTDFVGATSAIPVLLAANDEVDSSDLIAAWNQGYRFAVVDGTDPYIIMRSGNTASLLSIGGGSGGGAVNSVNGQTGAVVLSYTDFVGDSSTLPVLQVASMPSAADLLTAWGNGYRFLLVNNISDSTVEFYTLTKSGSTVTAVLSSGGGSSGGAEMDELWNNSSHTPSTFSAQTVSLSSPTSGYSYLLIKFLPFASGSSNDEIDFGIGPILGKSRLMVSSGASGNKNASRSYTVSANSIQFEPGYFDGSTGAGNCVPLTIYGVKFP